MKGRLAAEFVSWLDEAVQSFPQVKATADQWLAGLRKNPRVSQEEVADRGLDQFLLGQDGSIPRDRVTGYLEDTPVPWAQDLPAGNDFSDYRTPLLQNYQDRVVAEPAWTQRYNSSDHFPDYSGYQYHTAGGDLDTNLGRTRVLDEIQQDSRNVTKRFDPNRTQPDLTDMNQRVEDEFTGLLRHYNLDPRMQVNAYEADADDFGRALSLVDEEIANANDMGFLEELQDYRVSLEELQGAFDEPLNLPARTRYEWQGMARELQRALDNDADALVWPAGETQYKRYYKRTPEGYLRQAELDQRMPPGGGPPMLLDYISSKENLGMYRSAKRSMPMYRNQYDKRMPRDKRWKQLGLEPELVDLKNTGGREQGKYWAIKLTPEIKDRLAKSGIPYYAVGGMAVLGQQEGALEDGES